VAILPSANRCTASIACVCTAFSQSDARFLLDRLPERFSAVTIKNGGINRFVSGCDMFYATSFTLYVRLCFIFLHYLLKLLHSITMKNANMPSIGFPGFGKAILTS
jgi:hypothetical protein